MPIAFNCPHCGHQFEVADSYAGQTGPCAACKEMITVPGEAAPFAGSESQDPVPQKNSSAPLIIGILAGGLVLALFCGGVLAALLLPAVSAARDAARMAQCKNNAKMLSLGFAQLEVTQGRFPLASSRLVTGIPGKGDDPNAAGYAWTVAIMPYMDNQIMTDRLLDKDPELALSPFDASLDSLGYMRSMELTYLQCPSNPLNTESQQDDVYQSKDLPLGTSCFVVLSATHLTSDQGPLELFDANTDDSFQGNGVIVFPAGPDQKLLEGKGMGAIRDGLSNTFLFCETRELAYSAWIDGQVAWSVAAWPGNAQQPDANQTTDGFLGWADADFESKTSLLAGQLVDEQPEYVYLKASRIGGKVDRKFGPSSLHRGGEVTHCYADGAVVSVSPDIDRNLYLRLISADGGEPSAYR